MGIWYHFVPEQARTPIFRDLREFSLKKLYLGGISPPQADKALNFSRAMNQR